MWLGAPSRRCWIAVYLIAVLAAACWVFAPAAGYWTALSSPDDAPLRTFDWFANRLDDYLDGTQAISPFSLLLLIDPILRHEWAYIFCTLLFGGGMVCYLRSLRLGWISAVGGGLLVGFSGYFFTLFNAGHLGIFCWAATYLWCFGLLNRCLEGGRLTDFALLGCVVAWGQPQQPDLWLLGVGLLGLYALWRVRLYLRSWRRWGARFLVSLAIGVLTAWPSVRVVLTSTLASRDAQIAASSTPSAGQVSTEEAARERWDFATGWSLPPNEVVELAVASYYGNDSFRAPHPYWGALGRPHHFSPGKMMPNFRQHTTYLGLVGLLLALFSIAFRRSGATCPEGASACDDRPFWYAVWVGALLLAFGRFAPFYRLFYSLPYMDYLRAPVKFLHFVEVATAVLAAYGFEALRQGRARWKWLALPLAFVAATCLLACWTKAQEAESVRQISELGFGALARDLAAFSISVCWRAVGLAVLATGCFALAARGARQWAVALLILLGVADLSLVARRFVDVRDMAPFHRPNPAVKAMLRRTEGYSATVASYISPIAWSRDPFSTSLKANGLVSVLPDASEPQSPARTVAARLAQNPKAFWDYTGTRFVIVPPANATEVLRLSGGKAIYQSPQMVVIERPHSYPSLRDAGGNLLDAKVRMNAQRGKNLSLHTSGTVEHRANAPAQLILPTPWDARLKAQVDGRPVPLQQANEQWCAITVPPGTHTFSLARRRAPWSNLLSLIATFGILAWTAFDRRASRP